MHEGPDGHLWVVTHAGLDLYERETSAFRSVEQVAGINAISSDREGNLWIGYYSDGVARFRQGSFVTYTARDGLSDDQVTSVVQDGAGNIWIGTNKGLDHFRDGKFTTHTIPNLKTNPRINALALDRDGNLWAGTNDAVFQVKYDSRCPAGACRVQFVPMTTESFSQAACSRHSRRSARSRLDWHRLGWTPQIPERSVHHLHSKGWARS